METFFVAKPRTPKLIDLIKEREIKESTARSLALKRNVTRDLVSRLGLEKELEGHDGCVNCLQWSDNGEILASASDDMHIFLWNPFLYKKLCSFYTGHSGNIFSVNFMPKTNNNIVVSGAADARVLVFNLTLSEVLFACTCHTNRVKRVATAENMPYLFWSAAEDGLVLQHDLRTPHNCVTDRKTVLVDLIHHVGRNTEAKCMAINPARPELIAVGANDPYIRVYDRRMIKLEQPPIETFSTIEINRTQADSTVTKPDPNENLPIDCARYFVAGHLQPQYRDTVRSFAATYVTFSSDGTELLVNMGGEQIYLFDILNPRHNRQFEVTQSENTEHDFIPPDTQYDLAALVSSAYGTDSESTTDYPSLNIKVLPDNVEELKLDANNKFQLEKYSAAINVYNKALAFCPMAAVLYGNRAAAFMKRRWDGDIYAAMRDCQTTLLLDPDHVKAHFRLARCLFDLCRPYEAYKVIEDFQGSFPDYVSNAAHRALKKDITQAIRSNGMGHRLYEPTSSKYEQTWRSKSMDYVSRYCGHCNTTTDIKEANFFGNDGQYIVAGSDDGNIFVWDRYTTNIVRVLEGDSRIVNCLQPHPSSCFLATSGIDPVIRLWSPLPEDDKPNKREIQDTDVVAQTNQIRMHSDPFAVMMMNMGYSISRNSPQSDDDTETEDSTDPVVFRRTCRPS